MKLKDEIGRDELLKRAVTAAAPLSERGLVYAGFSLGGSVAQNLALGDERARGLLLLHGTSDIAEDTAADDLPVQLHVAEPDPFEPHDWLNAWYLRMRRAGADVEVFRYAGAGHLYTDPELPTTTTRRPPSGRGGGAGLPRREAVSRRPGPAAGGAPGATTQRLVRALHPLGAATGCGTSAAGRWWRRGRSCRRARSSPSASARR